MILVEVRPESTKTTNPKQTKNPSNTNVSLVKLTPALLAHRRVSYGSTVFGVLLIQLKPLWGEHRRPPLVLASLLSSGQVPDRMGRPNITRSGLALLILGLSREMHVRKRQ